MSRRLAAALALLACACASSLAHAGSLTVRDTNGAWTVTEDGQPDANDFLLKHLVNGTGPDDHFGRNGQTAFTLGSNNDSPASVRVDSTRRTWMVGAGLAGNQPQPVVARFQADGNADLKWGVQGKLQLTPAGIAIKPNDLLPLADGSVLVAGEVTGTATARAAVFHLNADGALDTKFGKGGVWQRPGDTEASTATSLAASTDGLVTVGVTVRGGRPEGELWSLTDAAPTLLQHQPQDPSSDGEDLRVEWLADHWSLSNGGGPTGIVPPALLTNRAPSPGASAVANDQGSGGLSPFVAESASAPAAEGGDEGLPWAWIGGGVIIVAAIGGVLLMRSREPKEALRKPPRR